jgi:hypothetical protein
LSKFPVKGTALACYREAYTCAFPHWEARMNKPKIQGGSCEVLPLQWCIVWSAYRVGTISWLALKVWCAAWLIHTSRCKQIRDGAPYRFQKSEFQPFFKSVGKKALDEALHVLEVAKILRFSDTDIYFASQLDDLEDENVKTRANVMFQQLHAHNRTKRMHFPRRLLKLITQWGQKVVRVATLLGLLFTSMLVKRYNDYRGCCKAEWIAHVFGVNVKGVNTERTTLINEGLFLRLPTSQRVRQRYGEWVVLNLAVVESCTPRQHTSEESSYGQRPQPDPSPNGQPLQNQLLSSLEEISKNQNIASERRTGAFQHVHNTNPTWDNIFLENLHNNDDSEILRQAAVKRGFLTDTIPERIHFFAAIEHSIRVATKNPAGLLRTIVEKGLWHFLTQADEDAAFQRLRRGHMAHETTPLYTTHISFLTIPYTDPDKQGDNPLLVLSKDALTVQTLKADLKRVGCTGNVLRIVQQHGYLQDWTIDRWAQAEKELVQVRLREMQKPHGEPGFDTVKGPWGYNVEICSLEMHAM